MLNRLVLFVSIIFLYGTALSQTMIWGTTFHGGLKDSGSIYKVKLDGTGFARVFSLSSSTGYAPRGGMVQAPNNKMYGIVDKSPGFLGAIFSFNGVNNGYAQVHKFTIAEGNPKGTLTRGPDDNLYGFTDNYLYRFNPVNNAFTTLVNFTGANGTNPQGRPTFASDGKLYGVCKDGPGDGIIFSYNISTQIYSSAYQFMGAQTNDKAPFGTLFAATNGVLYGFCGQINVNGGFSLFKFDPATTTFNIIHTFPVDKDYYPTSEPSLTEIQNSLFGFLHGIENTKGSIFKFNLTTNALTTPVIFDSVKGSFPSGGPTYDINDGTSIYGVTTQGGPGNYGKLFKHSTVNGYKVLRSFGVGGAHPVGPLSILPCVSPPAVPGTISVSGGTAGVCPTDVRTYTVPLVAGVTYTWTPPAGFSISSGQGTNSITGTYLASLTANGILSVKANNPCGSSTAKTLNINKGASPVIGNSISGVVSYACPGDTLTFSVPLTEGIVYYWSAAPANSATIIPDATNKAKVRVVFINDYPLANTPVVLSVYGTNKCGTSNTLLRTISRNTPEPFHLGVSGPNSGDNYFCPGESRTFGIVEGFTGINPTFLWNTENINAGYRVDTILNGGRAIKITMTWVPSQGAFPPPQGWDGSEIVLGSISLMASTSCGSSSGGMGIYRKYPICPRSSNLTDEPTMAICAGDTRTYKSNDRYDMKYGWYTSAMDLSNLAGQETPNGITITYGPQFKLPMTSFDLVLYAWNRCNNCYPAHIIIPLNVPIVPTSITGPTAPCLNSQLTTYTSSSVSNAKSYQWEGTGAFAFDSYGYANHRSIKGRWTDSGSIKVASVNACGTSAYTAPKYVKPIICSSSRGAEFSIANLPAGEFEIFPDPLRENQKLTLMFNSSLEEDNMLTISDVTGKVVFTKKLHAVQGNNVVLVDPGIRTKGIYLVSMRGKQTNKLKKLLIE